MVSLFYLCLPVGLVAVATGVVQLELPINLCESRKRWDWHLSEKTLCSVPGALGGAVTPRGSQRDSGCPPSPLVLQKVPLKTATWNGSRHKTEAVAEGKEQLGKPLAGSNVRLGF